MSFRVTTGGMYRTYRSNLNSNNRKLSTAMTKVETQRAFLSYGENPTYASKAFQLRRSMWLADDQIDNSNYLISKWEAGFQAMTDFCDSNGETADLSGIKEAIYGNSDTAGSSRNTLGTQLLSMSDSIMRTMNTTYDETFVFAGADGLHVPFSWDTVTDTDESGGTTTRETLLYRNVDVSSGVKYVKNDDGAMVPDTSTDSNYTLNDAGELVKVADSASNTSPVSVNSPAYCQKRLKDLAEEATYVDIGIGFHMDSSDQASQKIIPSSAFNSAMSGIYYLGNGTDEDGDSKNLVVLMHELGEIYSRCDPNNGEFATTDDRDRSEVLIDKVRDAIDDTADRRAELSAKVTFLFTNKDQLTETKQSLNVTLEETELMDPAEAIEEMVWTRYCYDASLRIGNQILSHSLIDYIG